MGKLDRQVFKQRIRRGQDEWRDIIARFERSGQTRHQFCTEHDLGLSTFSRWRHQRICRKHGMSGLSSVLAWYCV